MDSSIKKKITGPQNMKKQSHKNKKLIKKELFIKKKFRAFGSNFNFSEKGEIYI